MKRLEKNRLQRQISSPTTLRSLRLRFLAWLSNYNTRLTHRYQAFLSRRPHRSFQRTMRRDYVRSLSLPGYIAFTHHVTRTVLGYRKVFVWLIICYALIMVALGGVTDQSAYTQISDLLKESSQTLLDGGVDQLGQAGLLLAATVWGGGGSLSPDQQVYLMFTLLMIWLTTVWLLRELLLGRRPKLRDGLYNAGAPIIATLLVALVLLVQLLPLGLMALAYSGLTSVGLATESFGAMLFWTVTAMVAALVLYWVTSTLIAMVVVTLPGMYPLRAVRIASDLVLGRRVRILYRWLWAALVLLVSWVVVMIPIILLDGWIKGIWSQLQGIPLVPFVVALLSAASTVWFAAYVYLLYRKVVDDDAKPA